MSASPRVLLTMCGRKAYLARAMRAGDPDVWLVGADADPRAPARGAFDAFAAVPRVDAPGGAYVQALLELARRERVDAIASLNDMDAGVLARARAAFAAAGVRVLGPSAEHVERLSDKLACARWLQARGFDTADTRALEQARREGLPGSGGPWIAKPRRGQGSQRLLRLKAPPRWEELEEDLIFQPELQGRHFGADILRGDDGQLVVGLKEKLEMSAGTASLTDSSRAPELVEVARRLGELIAHVGLIDVDLVQARPGAAPWVLEINPRVGGCFAHACLACEGLAAALLDVCRQGSWGARPLAPRSAVRVYRESQPHVVP